MVVLQQLLITNDQFEIKTTIDNQLTVIKLVIYQAKYFVLNVMLLFQFYITYIFLLSILDWAYKQSEEETVGSEKVVIDF